MIKGLLFIFLLFHLSAAQKAHPAAAVPAKRWSTLSGNPPLVIGRGGLSGLFPEGCEYAVDDSKALTVADWVFMCNLQMTKDGLGLCLSSINLDNATNIATVEPEGQKTFNVNGKDVKGWFSVDYTTDWLLQNVSLTQGIYSRPNQYDGLFPIATPDTLQQYKISMFWLNVQYEAFYNTLGLPVVDYVLETLKVMKVDFLSSPEIGFLKTVNGRVNKAKTRVVFQFLEGNEVEPTTKQTYGDIAKNLAEVKLYASAIIVPKDYIWPVRPDKYLGLPTTIVADAHRLGLEVYASGFANDIVAAYNYSYDPSAEYLQFMNNGDSVDGFITDYPPTASAAVVCLASNSKPVKGPTLVISSNGASGIYPGSTDLAYQQAVDDGADILDCSVQMTKDGVAFCLDTADLMQGTTAMTKFMSRSATVPEIQPKNGIFSFDLTWSEIQTIKPQIVSLFASTNILRNPAYKNSGKFLTLPEFLEFAKAKAPAGILINIQNAFYLASKKGIDIVGTVTSALKNASLDSNSTKQVMIQSPDIAVLAKFEDNPNYKRVYLIDDKIGDAPPQTVEEIKKHAQGVNLPKSSVIRAGDYFTTSLTNVVKEMKDANLTVFVHVMKNEYVSLAFDYIADPLIEIATFVQSANVDGIVTEFPATMNRYLWSACSDTGPGKTSKYEFLQVNPGDLAGSVAEAKPPAAAPLPPLQVADVVEPPLPAVTTIIAPAPAAQNQAESKPAAADSDHSDAWTNVANLGLSLVAAILVFGIMV